MKTNLTFEQIELLTRLIGQELDSIFDSNDSDEVSEETEAYVNSLEDILVEFVKTITRKK